MASGAALRVLLVTPFVPDARVGHGTATVATHVVEHFARRHDLTVACFAFSDAASQCPTSLRIHAASMHTAGTIGCT